MSFGDKHPFTEAKPKKKVSETIQVMYFSLSENDKIYHDFSYVIFNPTRHLKYDKWFKQQCLISSPQTVHVSAKRMNVRPPKYRRI